MHTLDLGMSSSVTDSQNWWQWHRDTSTMANQQAQLVVPYRTLSPLKRSLPAEIVMAIIDVCDRDQLRSLATVNRLYGSVASRRLWSDLAIRFTDRDVGVVVELLETVLRSGEGGVWQGVSRREALKQISVHVPGIFTQSSSTLEVEHLFERLFLEATNLERVHWGVVATDDFVSLGNLTTRSTRLKSLTLDTSQLKIEDFEISGPGVQREKYKLHLRFTNFVPHDGKFDFKSLRKVCDLTSLELPESLIYRITDDMLQTIMEDCCGTLKHLTLSAGQLDLTPLLTNTFPMLETVKLIFPRSTRRMSSQRVQEFLVKFLAQQKTIKSLSLGVGNIGDTAIKDIWSQILTLPVLKHLRVIGLAVSFEDILMLGTQQPGMESLEAEVRISDLSRNDSAAAELQSASLPPGAETEEMLWDTFVSYFKHLKFFTISVIPSTGTPAAQAGLVSRDLASRPGFRLPGREYNKRLLLFQSPGSLEAFLCRMKSLEWIVVHGGLNSRFNHVLRVDGQVAGIEPVSAVEFDKAARRKCNDMEDVFFRDWCGMPIFHPGF